MIGYDEQHSIDFGLGINAANDEYAALHGGQRINDGGMTSVMSQRAAWDFYVGGLDWPTSKTKHLNEYRAQYGLPPAGGAPNPNPPSTAPITSRLVVRGVHFELETGEPALLDGATLFTLPARWCNGEDITPQVTWMQRHRVNKARMFPNWTTVAGGGGVHAGDRGLADQGRIRAYADLAIHLASYGIRSQFSVITENGLPHDYWRRGLQWLYDIAAESLAIVMETHNEPWLRDIPLSAILPWVDRHGVLSSTGILAEADVPDGFKPMPAGTYLEFGTHRTSRDQYVPKNGKDLLDLRTTPIPWIDDEPIGIMDAPNRGGRTNDFHDVVSHFAVARLFGSATIHTQAGIDGLTPEQTNEPMTESICQAIGDLWGWMPPSVSRGSYINVGRGGNGPGILYAPNDSKVNRCYGMQDGSSLWVVVPVPRDGWVAQPAPGWRVADVGPVPYVVRCEPV